MYDGFYLSYYVRCINLSYVTELYCKDCKEPVSMKSTNKWISLKCLCRCAIYYSTGHFTVIPKKVYLKNKENDK